jgi:hypothetical protein
LLTKHETNEVASFTELKMPKKQKGVCPFCSKTVEPKVIEENTVRRDKLQCADPECGEYIYLCRSPGCHNFAKGTSVYDHELCPSCTDTVGTVAAEVGKTVLKVGATVATTLITAAAMAAMSKDK